MRIFICLAIIAVTTATPVDRNRRGVIHQEAAAEEKHDEDIGSTGYHHEIQHEHAKSHQSIKFHHFHPVPVYIKKEHEHLLKHPLEEGKSAHVLKQLHPKTEHNHGYGLVLENHGYHQDLHGRSDDHGLEQNEHTAQLEQGNEHQGFESYGGQIEEGEGHGWEAQAEHAPVYEAKGLQEEEEHYDFPADFSHYSGHEAEETEGY